MASSYSATGVVIRPSTENFDFFGHSLLLLNMAKIRSVEKPCEVCGPGCIHSSYEMYNEPFEKPDELLGLLSRRSFKPNEYVMAQKWAIIHGLTVSLNMLLDAYPARTMRKNMTLLMYACMMGGRLEVVELLIRRGQDVNATNFRGESAIHIAAKRRDVRLIRYLISQGANPRAVNGKGHTALIHALKSRKWNPDHIISIFDLGVLPNAQDIEYAKNHLSISERSLDVLAPFFMDTSDIQLQSLLLIHV